MNIWQRLSPVLQVLCSAIVSSVGSLFVSLACVGSLDCSLLLETAAASPPQGLCVDELFSVSGPVLRSLIHLNWFDLIDF